MYTNFSIYAFLGVILSIPVIVLSRRVASKWIKKSLKNRGIIVSSGYWHGPELHRLVRQEFIDYLKSEDLYNPDALKELIENTQGEIDARWRAIALHMTLLTLVVALYIGYYQTMFSQWLGGLKPSSNVMIQLAVSGILAALGMYQIYLFLSILLSFARTSPVIYMAESIGYQAIIIKQV
jgi:hypothetical protein